MQSHMPNTQPTEISPKQQVLELVKGHQRFWILTHRAPDGDALGSSLALGRVLAKLGKSARVFADGQVASQLDFVADRSKLESTLPTGEQAVLLSLPIKPEEKAQLFYTRDSTGALNIKVTLLNRKLEEGELELKLEEERPEVIIFLDTADLPVVGALADTIKPLMESITTLCIDHHKVANNFTTVLFRDTAATSTAEVLVGLIEALSGKENLFDADIATLLLLGLITDTGSFQNENTTPKSLTVAAQLVAAGARQQEIVKNVFRTKRMPQLKLWGRALERMTRREEGNFTWAALSQKDFQETGTEEEDSSGVIDELMKAVPDVDFVALLSERKEGLHGSLRATREGVDVATRAARLGGGGHTAAAGFFLPGATLEKNQPEVLTKLAEPVKG